MAYQLISSVTTPEGQTYVGEATEITGSTEVYGPAWYIGVRFDSSRARAEFENKIQPYGAHLLRLDVYEDWEMMPEAPSEFPTVPMFWARYRLVGWAHASPGLPVVLIAALPAIIQGVIHVALLFVVLWLATIVIEGIKDIMWGEKIPGEPGERKGGILSGLSGVVVVGVAAVGGIYVLSQLFKSSRRGHDDQV